MDLCFKNIIVIIIENVSNWESLVNNRIIKTDEHADNAANEENLNRNSVDFLNYALNKMNLKKKMINNIDLMIVSEEPKINPYFKKILESISKNLNINKNIIC